MKYFEGLSQEEKMKMWHAGQRGFNVDAASNEKLKMNLDICKKLRFKTEAALISKELELRKHKGLLHEESESGAQTSSGLQAFAPENALGRKKSLDKWNDGGFDKAYEEVFGKVLSESIGEPLTAKEVCENNCEDPTDLPLVKDFFKYKRSEFDSNDTIDNEEDYNKLVDEFLDYVSQDTINYEVGNE